MFRQVVVLVAALAVLGSASSRVETRAARQAPLRHASLILTNGTIVTVDESRRILYQGAVAIEGDRIVAVDAAARVLAEFRADETIDVSGQVVLPGLVNTHTHAPMVLYRGLADDLALMEWLERYIFPAEAKTVSPEFVRVGTRLAALEMIESGTTAYADMYYFEEEIAQVTRDAGLRGVLGQTIIGFPAPDAKSPAEALARTEAFIKNWREDSLVVPAVAPHAMYTLDAKWLKTASDLAARYRVPLLTHLAETKDEVKTAREKYEMTPTAYLESLGFFQSTTVAAHGVWMTDADIEILRRRQVGVSHNPESNMKLASGVAPVVRYLQAGVTLGLGTDGAASNNDLDMFDAMRQAALLHKLATGDPTAVPAHVALEMATLGGARALGLGGIVGSLEVGKRADVISVAMTGARQTPMYNPVSHLVYVSRGADVQTTIVNGRVLMRDRKVLSLDAARVEADARAMAERVQQAVRQPVNPAADR